jgi:hypothetical protein
MTSKYKTFEEELHKKYKNFRQVYMILAHSVLSENSGPFESAKEYDENSCFYNNGEGIPDITIYEVDQRPKFVYLLEDESEIDDLIPLIERFIDKAADKDETFDDTLLRPKYKNLLNEIAYDEKMDEIELIFFVTKNLQQQFEEVERDFCSNPALTNMGNVKVMDLKILMKKVNADDSSDGFEVPNEIQSSFTFDFKNDNASDSKKDNIIQYFTSKKEETVKVLALSAYSLYRCYQNNSDSIFKDNIRYSISSSAGGASKSVNEEIRKTIESEPENFLIYNNGIVIVAESVDEPDILTNKIKIHNYSVVNGAQTITNIHEWAINKKNDPNKLKDIYVIAKIICTHNKENIVDKITKAANNQKAVLPRDFRSNSKEMIDMQKSFLDSDIVLNIKRGENLAKLRKRIAKKTGKDEKTIITIENTKLAQYVITTYWLNPCFASQNKNKIFIDKNPGYTPVFIKTPHDVAIAVTLFCESVRPVVSSILSKIISTNNGTNQENKKIGDSFIFWMIALLWLLCVYRENIEDLIADNGVIANLSKSKFEFTESFGTIEWNKFDFESGEFEDFVYDAYEKMEQIYGAENIKNINDKKKPLTEAAFSFRREPFIQFLAGSLKVRVGLMSGNKLKSTADQLRKLFKE